MGEREKGGDSNAKQRSKKGAMHYLTNMKCFSGYISFQATVLCNQKTFSCALGKHPVFI